VRAHHSQVHRRIAKGSFEPPLQSRGFVHASDGSFGVEYPAKSFSPVEMKKERWYGKVRRKANRRSLPTEQQKWRRTCAFFWFSMEEANTRFTVPVRIRTPSSTDCAGSAPKKTDRTLLLMRINSAMSSSLKSWLSSAHTR